MSTFLVIAGLIAAFAVLCWFVGFLIHEAERKLERELTFFEVFVGAMAGLFPAMLIVMLLPEPTKKNPGA
jgi:hypothetical protein